MEIQVTRVFQQLWESQKRINLLRGGSRSSKSYSLIQMVFLWLKTGKINNMQSDGQFVIARATLPALKRTIYKEFITVLHKYNFYNQVEHSKTERAFRYKNREVLFFSLDDPEKVKGLQTAFFWINEGNDVDYDSFNQLLMRCENCCWLDYNPSGEPFIKTELEQKRMVQKNDCKLMVSTIYDNPYLPKPMVEEITNLQDEDLRQIYLYGNWATLKGRIYNNWNEVDELPEDYYLRFYGLDFGFSNSPSAMVEIRKTDKGYFCKELIYQHGLTNDDISQLVKPKGKVIADAAEPKSIEDLKRKGWNVKAAPKGRDSVNAGISKLLEQNIFFTKDSINLKKEYQMYRWDVDRDDQPTNTPIKAFDHCMDAIRYGIHFHTKKSHFQLIQ